VAPTTARERTRRGNLVNTFEATSFDGGAALGATEEMSELQWFSRLDLPKPLFPPLRRLLDGECFGTGIGPQ
jgi:hypothetical protein